MKRIACFLIVPMLVSLVSCTTEPDDDDGWNAAKVCPETGTNSYGMPNRGTFTDERDENVYRYTTIGGQVWMAENLRFELPHPYSQCYGMEYCYPKKRFLTDTATICRKDTTKLADIAQKMQSTCTDNDCIAEEYCEKFGRYYKPFLTDSIDQEYIETICPKGWHMPSKEEFDILMKNVDKKQARLVSSDFACKDSNSVFITYGEDACGFALCNFSEDFSHLLSKTLKSPTINYELRISAYQYGIMAGGFRGFIRCVKD